MNTPTPGIFDVEKIRIAVAQNGAACEIHTARKGSSWKQNTKEYRQTIKGFLFSYKD